ncbi:hypothetical protein DPMN_140930 [Dreissena polymorpha]|uniref:Uncharacterized protein n=1 Tax=Dreissena polymorpha TaxID=45954 RepID=A0A9D4JHU2_DREPO|nr:hypothetical protein DPMN_140930 [Dreissena polymorpha]
MRNPPTYFGAVTKTMTKNNDLKKKLSQRLGLKKIIERFIEKLAEAKEEDDLLQYETAFEARLD